MRCELSSFFIPKTDREIAAGTVLANPSGVLANPVGVDAEDMRDLISAVGYNTYSEFLSTTSTVIEISSGTYTVPSDSTVIADVRGLTRHWVGGVFVKDNTATVDGGCVIANTAGDKYVRQWDKTNAVPEFYRLGVDSIASDTDAISRALSQLNNGGTVHLQREKTYIGETVAIGKGCTITGGTIKRAQLVRTTLAANASVSNTSITVTSATGFRIGMSIQIANGTTYADLATNDSTNFSITNIVGNVITLNQAIQVGKSSGASVFQIADQLNYSGAINANIDCNVYLDNVTFDGNESQNAISRAWTVNNLGVFSSRLQNFRVNGCLIINQPSECFTVATRAWFTDCYFNNVWGSCIHGSAANLADYEPGGVWINSCYFENVCRSTAAENGHSTELGVYTQSQNTQHVGFDDCVLEDTNNGYIVSAVSNLLSILRCRAKDCKGIAFDANRTTAIDGPIVVDNQFQDCGNLTIGGAGDVPIPPARGPAPGRPRLAGGKPQSGHFSRRRGDLDARHLWQFDCSGGVSRSGDGPENRCRCRGAALFRPHFASERIPLPESLPAAVRCAGGQHPHGVPDSSVSRGDDGGAAVDSAIAEAGRFLQRGILRAASDGNRPSTDRLPATGTERRAISRHDALSGQRFLSGCGHAHDRDSPSPRHCGPLCQWLPRLSGDPGCPGLDACVDGSLFPAARLVWLRCNDRPSL